MVIAIFSIYLPEIACYNIAMKATDIFLRNAVMINIILAVLALGSFGASFFPDWHIWGMDYIAIVPLGFRVIPVFLLLLMACPTLGRKTGEIIESVFSSRSAGQLTAFYFSMSGVVFILSLILHSQALILGDGFNILGNLAAGQSWSATEPLEYLLHHLIALLIGGQNAALNSYIIASHLAFAVLFISLFILIANKIDLIIGFSIICCFSVLQFFFGYVENYTFAFVFNFIFLMLALRDYSQRRISIACIATLVISVGFHLKNIIFLPVLIPILLTSYRNKNILATSIVAIIVIGFATASLLFKTDAIESSSVFVSFIKSSSNPYSLFSGQHIFDMFNIVMLNFPLLLIIPFVGIKRDLPKLLLYLTALLPSVLFTVLIDPKIGAPRDWDLLSVAAAPIIVLLINAIVAWGKAGAKAKYVIITPILLFAMLHTGGWIYGNTLKDSTYTRIKTQVKYDIHYSASYYGGYRNKSWANLANIEYKDLGEAIRAIEIRYNADPVDTMNTCNLAKSYFLSGDTARAVQFVKGSWRRIIKSSNAASLFGSMMLVTKNYKEAEQIYRADLADSITETNVIFNLAFVLDQLGRVDSALIFYDRAYALWENVPVANAIGFYFRAMSLKKYDMAESGFRRIYGRIPSNYQPPISALLSALASKNYALADSLTIAYLRVSQSREPGNTR